MDKMATATDEICTDGPGSDCRPSWSHDGPSMSTRIGFLLSSLTFLACFIIAAAIVRVRRVYASISNGAGVTGYKSTLNVESSGGTPSQRLGERAFVTTMGATGVLGLLILCEVSDWLNPSARRMWFSIIIWILLISLVVVMPLIQLHGVLTAVGLAKLGEGKRWFQVLRAGLYLGWLWLFWIAGGWIPVMELDEMYWWGFKSKSFTSECLSRIGVLGITLIAMLSAFGAVSTPWQAFIKRPRPVAEADIARAQEGLEATNELLEIKKENLEALRRKVEETRAHQTGLMSKALSAVTTDPDAAELSLLQTEVNGLQFISHSLNLQLQDLRSRYTPPVTLRPQHPLHFFLQLLRKLIPLRPGYLLFSLYCLYRILATVAAHLPYPFSLVYTFDPANPASPQAYPGRSASESDPVNRILALAVRYWDPALDRTAWAREIGFGLCGVIIAGSINTILRAVNTLTKLVSTICWFPSSATINPQLPPVGGIPNGDLPFLGRMLALCTAQITATYVLASVLLLRLNLSPEMSSALAEAIGAPAMVPGFFERWFDGVFLWSVGTVGLGYIIGRTTGLINRDEDECEDERVGGAKGWRERTEGGLGKTV
ncbi:Abscisic acid G-protein coupled receptor-domain-containing protein [Kalaharituber pfeilii]|nr:Abscisic acid G-protein coupled receptor-domain-containing protein [Kalaharituber pfeilii]